MTDNEFEKVLYTGLKEQPLTWYEYFFGKTEDEVEIEADPLAKASKYLVTQQIKNSKSSHNIIKMHQRERIFEHIQSVVKTDQKIEDQSNALPSPYKSLPEGIPQKKLHPSIAQLRRKGIKDDIDL